MEFRMRANFSLGKLTPLAQTVGNAKRYFPSSFTSLFSPRSIRDPLWLQSKNSRSSRYENTETTQLSRNCEENMNRFWRSVAQFGLVLVASFTWLVPASAQQTLGSINGTVLDQSGAAVPGATVTVTDTAINLTRATTTQSTGFYQIFNLPIGTYTVSVKHEGFDSTQITGIDVQEATAKTVNATLKVGQVSESVSVTGTPLLNATDATNGYTLDSQQIDLTPLATGSFTQIAALSPGVNAELLSNLDTNAGLGNQPIWANGQRDTSNTFQVNGVDSTNLFNGKSSSGSTSQRYNFNIGGGSTSSASSAGSGTIAGANLT